MVKTVKERQGGGKARATATAFQVSYSVAHETIRVYGKTQLAHYYDLKTADSLVFWVNLSIIQ